MIRTRDLFLFATIVVFLLVGIGSTLVGQYFDKNEDQTGPLSFEENSDESYETSSPDYLQKLRETRLESIKQKIADGADVFVYEGDIEEVPTTTEESDEPTTVAVKTCAGYNPFTRAWNASEVQFEVVEGARQFYQNIVASTSATTTEVTKETLVALPLSPLALATPSCLNSDVIGITVGGILIRNSEAGRYAALPENILVGYALDGFPIYGRSDKQRDDCGGIVISGQYRYQIDSNVSTIVQCFSAAPATI